MRAREELFLDLFEQAPIGYHEINDEGIITRVNRTESKMLGWTVEEMIGQPVWKFTSNEGDSRESIKAKLGGSLQPGRAFERTYRKKDGTTITVLIEDRLLEDKGGRIKGMRSTIQNITDRKFLEDQLAQAQKLESIGQLAAGIAHEINTPIQYVGDNTRFLQDVFGDLNRLLGKHERLLQTVKAGTISVDIIQEVEDTAKEVDLGYLSGEIPKAIQQTLEGVERVANIVRAMKEFSHPGTAEKIGLDINKAIESTVTVSRNEWKYVAEMVTEFDYSLPLVPCLPGEFNQVILNMIINAAHAIADVVGDGSAGKGTIRVSTQRDGNRVEIRISDTGTGIPEGIRDRVFDPFFTTKKVGKGTGQGLAIAHSLIVDKHGGTIAFETEMGKGTSFIIKLPLNEDQVGRVS
jgi:PAS domain S-box-containing protein